MASFALAGIAVSCSAALVAGPQADDFAVDELWLALRRGDLTGAEAAARQIDDPLLAERAQRDIEAARWGRSTALVSAWADGSWWEARYLASSVSAREILDGVGADRQSAAWALERSRRAATADRREAWARKALAGPAGSTEAWALVAESLFARRDWEGLISVFKQSPPNARLNELGRRFAMATGRGHEALDGLIRDLERGRLTPTGLGLLGQLLLRVPQPADEARALALLEQDTAPGHYWEQGRLRLLAQLRARAGDLAGASQALSQVSGLSPNEARRGSRWQVREARELGEPQNTPEILSPEESIDGDTSRLTSAEMLRLRWFHEWDLAARKSYKAALAGKDDDLDQFLEGLDEAAAFVGGAPPLSAAGLRDYGVFGELLATDSMAESMAAVFVLGGEGFLLPPEITMYDRLSSRAVKLETGSYDEVSVRHLRVPGFVASQGAEFTGAGIVDTVFLDEERVAAQVARMSSTLAAPEPLAQLATDRATRRALTEPLDAGFRLQAAVVQDAGEGLHALVRESLALHEGQHIIDVQAFLQLSQLGRLSELVSAGLLPGAVRAEVERKAQLRALRECSDPRLPLADLVAQLPVEGPRLQSEHARGYVALLGEFIELLDSGNYAHSQPLQTWGIDPQRVLVQQLHKLPKSVVRAVAQGIAD